MLSNQPQTKTNRINKFNIISRYPQWAVIKFTFSSNENDYASDSSLKLKISNYV